MFLTSLVFLQLLAPPSAMSSIFLLTGNRVMWHDYVKHTNCNTWEVGKRCIHFKEIQVRQENVPTWCTLTTLPLDINDYCEYNSVRVVLLSKRLSGIVVRCLRQHWLPESCKQTVAIHSCLSFLLLLLSASLPGSQCVFCKGFACKLTTCINHRLYIRYHIMYQWLMDLPLYKEQPMSQCNLKSCLSLCFTSVLLFQWDLTVHLFLIEKRNFWRATVDKYIIRWSLVLCAWIRILW